jgi:hypothetical protein
MLKILIQPRLLFPGFRVVVLIVIILITYRVAPSMALPLGHGGVARVARFTAGHRPRPPVSGWLAAAAEAGTGKTGRAAAAAVRCGRGWRTVFSRSFRPVTGAPAIFRLA